MKRYRFLCGFAVIACLFFFTNVQAQEKYPSRTIEITVGWGAGGTNDIAARVYTEKLGQILGVQVIVINRPGGNGATGCFYVIKGKKDGYSLFSGENPSIIFTPLIATEASYDPLNDLIPLGYQGGTPSFFSVREDSPIKTFKELIEYARKNPGKLKNSAAGMANTGQFNLDMLCSKENIEITQVAFKGGSEATIALLGGHVDMSVSSPTNLGAQIKAGKLRGLATSSKRRLPDFPDIPTTAELGYPYVNYISWHGLFAPAGTPKPIIDVLVPAIEKAFKDPQVLSKSDSLYLEIDYKGPAEFRKFVEGEIEATRKIVKEEQEKEKGKK